MSTIRSILAASGHADLRIFHAYECSDESELCWANVPGESIKQFNADRRDQALANMESLLDRNAVPGSRAISSVECGNPRTLIAAKAAELGSDLIVIGKHGRSSIGELFLGGVTRHTVARADCDVALVPEYPRL